ECVAEAGGSVQWTPTNTKQVKQKAATRRQSSRQRPQSGIAAQLSQMMRPGGEAPSLSWVFAGALVLLWIVGLFSSNLPYVLLAAAPEVSWQVWRYATAPFAAFAAF